MQKRIMELILIIKEWKFQKKKILEECLFATGGKKEIKSDLNTRKSGSAALDLAYVASGRLDGFFHNKINLWDVAAGALLVQEAGGIVNNLNQFEINKINIRASSTSINDQMLKSLQNF